MNNVNVFDSEIAVRVKSVDKFVENYLNEMALPHGEAILELRKSMLYSASNGGKRFRPLLSLLVGELLGCAEGEVLPFAAAVEFIHTYSLIHDDLPCMDNDDVRRGKPTNHKVFGEDFALLSGDALLTEAFFLITEGYKNNSFLIAPLCRLLSEAAGIRGMVGGQAIDLKAGQKTFTQEELSHLHLLKTGALIRVAIEGAAVIAKATPAEIAALKKFGEALGIAFQVADDILDHGEKDQDQRSFTGIIGLENTKKYLSEISENALLELQKISQKSAMLEHLINYNQTRQV